MHSTSSQFSRRDFLKLSVLSLLAACHGPQDLTQDSTPTTTALPPSQTPSASTTPTVTSAPTEVPPTPTATTPPDAATLRKQARQKLIDKYGPASKALPLEFHGDHYWFFDGGYSMNPEGFVEIMTWFQQNNVWSVNSEELLGFLDGTLQIPARSVILTTDSGASSMDSLERMVPVLQQTGMHFISFIWTMQMTAEETSACPDNLCWKRFNWAKETGVFSFGTHSEYHLPLADYDQTFGFEDLQQSILEIEDNLGITPKLLSWPNESCPAWMDDLPLIGIKAAFGGRSRPLARCAVYAKDDLRYCLPRLFPPNSHDGLSGRPEGMTLQEMAVTYMDGWKED
jgi:peptidoglycan/xylan/chitin deacetylase (PgdA/CDA1 family)